MAEKKRWRRIARIFLIIILILGAALGAVVAVAVNQPEMLGLGETLARQIEEATGLECRVGGPVELGIFPEPHIQAYRVMIYAPASDQAQAKNDQFERQTAAAADADMAQPANPASEQELLLNIAAVRVEVKVLPLLWGAFELKRLKIYDPLLHLDVLTKQWPELGVGASADPGSGSGPDSDPDFGPAPDTETPVFGGPAAVNASLPPASVLSDIPVTPPLPELEAASVETWETIIDLLQGIRVSGGVILDKTAAGDSQVLVSGLSFRARGDDLSLSLRSHILADERNAPSTLDLRLNDLRLSGNALSAALELRADINILQQSVEPDIQVNLSYDLLSGSLRLDDLRLALEKLRIKGTAALDFGGPEFSAQGKIEKYACDAPPAFLFSH